MLSACVVAITLGGCGGSGTGGGGGPQPISAPPAAPPPPPPPPPPPSPTPPSSTSVNYNDAEYQRSNGASAHGALTAYTNGGTGRGTKIAIVDSGINPNLADFAGRIDPASQDIVAGRGVTDTEGHGTAVAGVAAAGRNGTNSLGVAFDATIISLNTSNPNDCGENGCSHSDSAIAKAIDVARVNGAKVINISLGGDGVGSSVVSAVARAAADGIVVVVSAGNESAANPSAFALGIAQIGGNGNVIIAGAMNAGGEMASFSNLAGSGSQYFLTALGDRVRTLDEKGQATLWSGTSFSAPVISGAAALLASAFPNLTGAQIVQLLLTTANDAGTAGRDSRFGNGILNITRAFAPQGQTIVAGSTTPISTTDNGAVSTTMGDANVHLPGAVIFDGYARAYALDLARTIGRAAREMPLTQAFDANMQSGVAMAGRTAVAVTIDRKRFGEPVVGLAQFGMSYDDSRKAKAIAGLAVSRITPKMAVALGFAESGDTLKKRLAGREANAFLVARDPMERTGFYGSGRTSFGVRQGIGSFGLTVTSEQGKVYDPNLRAGMEEPRYTMGSASLDRKFGLATLSIGASRLSEQSTLLGARFSPAFTTGGATSHFLDASAAFDLGKGWGAFASYRRGWTEMPGAGTLVSSGKLSTDAFAFDLSKTNAFFGGDKLAFRFMQPLRVRSGGFAMLVPTSYDYASHEVGFTDSLFSLAPKGRELDFEAAYGVGLWGGSLSANAFLRKDPGNIAAAGDDVGAAVRFSLGF
jgi:hypothetical protein